MALTREQQKVAQAIYTIGRRRGVSPMVLKSAFETGLVESHLQNLAGGDKDSAGWRQERASLYPNPTNLRASINRYFNEATKLHQSGRYTNAGSLAADVQRPAAQFRGRYAGASGRAGGLINRLGGFSGTGGGSAGSVTQTTTTAGGTGLDVPGVDTSALAALLSQPTQTQAPSSSYLTPPSGSAQSYLPGTGLQLSYTQQPAAQDSGLAAKLAAIGTLNPDTTLSTAAKSTTKTTVVPATGQPGTSPGITAPGSAPDALRTMIERANAIDKRHYAYEWGGGHNAGVTPSHGTGHGSGAGVGYDCSGVVSKVLGVNARVSGQFEKWGQAGKGKSVTVYANGTHVLMEINGHFFGTSSTNPGGGAGWIKRSALPPGYLKNFTARHPNGL